MTPKEIDFLKPCYRHDDGAACQLLAKMMGMQRDVRCVRRAIILIVLSSAILAYPACLLENFPDGVPDSISKLFIALAGASLISFFVFGGLWLIYRGKLRRCREQYCRDFATQLEFRFGKEGAADKATL